jgi:probable phosphoglycerate mutase
MNLFAIRHGETAWSLSGQHTGTTDIPLTDNGRRLAERLRPVLAKEAFALVLVSPMQRARETCDLAGLVDRAVIDHDLVEWNYGQYEGLTPQQINEVAPGWLIFRDGCPGGEAPEDVGDRVDRVIARVRAAEGDCALFAHGHLLRVFGARWLGLSARAGQHLILSTGAVSVLGYYHDIPAVRIWNWPVAENARAAPRRHMLSLSDICFPLVVVNASSELLDTQPTDERPRNHQLAVGHPQRQRRKTAR